MAPIEVTEDRQPSTQDLQFLQRAGIEPDLTPALTRSRLWLLVLAAALAGGTTLFSVAAQAGSPGAVLSDCATQCPMGDGGVKTAR